MSVALVSFGLTISSARADSPEAMVKKLATDVTKAVRADPDLQNPQSTKMSDLIQRQVAPRFDFDKITQQAMGKNWPKASGDEKRQIVQQFSLLLIRTYSKAIANLKDLDVEVKSTRVNSAGSDVTVRTQMVGRWLFMKKPMIIKPTQAATAASAYSVECLNPVTGADATPCRRIKGNRPAHAPRRH